VGFGVHLGGRRVTDWFRISMYHQSNRAPFISQHLPSVVSPPLTDHVEAQRFTRCQDVPSCIGNQPLSTPADRYQKELSPMKEMLTRPRWEWPFEFFHIALSLRGFSAASRNRGRVSAGEWPIRVCWRAFLTLRCAEEWAPPARMNVCGASRFPVLYLYSGAVGGWSRIASTIGELDSRGPQ
jgi:hypothetical protein